MPISIGKQPENDFTNPLGMLSDCHRRIEKFLHLLVSITEQAKGAALTEEQRDAFQKALHYFQKSAPNHTQDEEASLFPRMQAANQSLASEALAELQTLHDEHQLADRFHNEVEAIGQDWLRQGHLDPERVSRLKQLLTDLQTIYQRHIAIEDEKIFPLAAEWLNADELASLAAEMAARRGIDIQKWQKLL